MLFHVDPLANRPLLRTTETVKITEYTFYSGNYCKNNKKQTQGTCSLLEYILTIIQVVMFYVLLP